jgi:hypothetical protein
VRWPVAAGARASGRFAGRTTTARLMPNDEKGRPECRPF